MKHIILSMTMGSLFLPSVLGQEISLNKDLPAPNSSGLSMQKDGQIAQLKKMLDNKELSPFYNSARQYLQKFKEKPRNERTKADMNDLLWTLYLVCGAPLYELDVDSDEPWPYREDNDIITKMVITYFISIRDSSLEKDSKLLGMSQQHLKEINSTYFASLLKTLQSALIPDADQRAKAFQKRIGEFGSNSHVYQDRCSKYNSLERRDNDMRFFISSIMERRFMNMLMQYFPKNATEVVKYIKMAGYKDGEIFELINRTVGSDPKAAYLVKE